MDKYHVARRPICSLQKHCTCTCFCPHNTTSHSPSFTRMEKRPSQQYYAGSAWTTNIKYPLLGETQDDATPMLLRPCPSFDHAQLHPHTLKPTLPHAHTQALPSPTLCRARLALCHRRMPSFWPSRARRRMMQRPCSSARARPLTMPSYTLAHSNPLSPTHTHRHYPHQRCAGPA
jgi:hypothetical protein